MERSAASEGVPAALRLSKSTQSADKVHFSDSTRLRGEPEFGDRYHFSSGHYRSFTSVVDQFKSFFITKYDFWRNKTYFLPLGCRRGKVQP